MHFDGSDVQYVVALDKRTGKTVWKTDRSVDFQDIQPNGKPKADGDFRKAFATPQIVMAGGRPVMVSLGSMAAYGYDPLTGKELWRVVERGNFSIEHPSGRRQRARLLSHRFQHGADLRGAARRQRRRDVDPRRVEGAARGAEQAVASCSSTGCSTW